MGEHARRAAASSSEMDRARLAFDAIKAAPECELALDWIAQIETVGVANEGIPIVEGASYAAQSVLAVQACDVFVFLIPATGGSRGAWFELGLAVAQKKRIVVVGDPVPVSIFASLAATLGTHVESDEQAIREVRTLARQR